MGRKPPRRSPLLGTTPRPSARTTTRLAARSRPRRRRHTLTSVQLWAAIAGIIGSLTSVPALVISLNALRISEGQRADALKISAKQQAEAQRLKAETNLANQRAFAQHVTVDTPDITSKEHPEGEPAVVINNSNRIMTNVQMLVGNPTDEQAPEGPWTWEKTAFLVPACSEVTYTHIAGSNNAASTDFAVLNPVDSRWWTTGPFPEPLDAELQVQFNEVSGTSGRSDPSKIREVPGCA